MRIEPKNGELGIQIVPDANVSLYYDSSKKFETANLGGVLQGGSPYSELLVQTSGGVHQGKLQGWASGNDREMNSRTSQPTMVCKIR